MTTGHNPKTLAAAAREVLRTCCEQTDAAYVAEVHLELELIEQGFMGFDDEVEAIELGSDDTTGDTTVIAMLGSGTNLIVNTRTGAVTVSY